MITQFHPEKNNFEFNERYQEDNFSLDAEVFKPEAYHANEAFAF